NSPLTVWSLLSKMSSTVACETGLREVEPEKITSVSESPRRRLAELSPMTQRTASMMFDLPQPLGPTTPVMLVGRCRTVGSTKDLKPESLIVDRRMRRSGASGGARTGRGDGSEWESSRNAAPGPHPPQYTAGPRPGPAPPAGAGGPFRPGAPAADPPRARGARGCSHAPPPAPPP